MTPRLDIASSPVPLERFATHFDPLFSRRNQRESFRRYLEGLLLGQERNKTLTALANAEPVVGALYASVQTLQWFLSESCWQASFINATRKKLLLENPHTAPTPQGALVIDETSDRKDGKMTAHHPRSRGYPTTVPGQRRQSGQWSCLGDQSLCRRASLLSS